MKYQFGELLRRLRENAQKTMGQVAAHLGISVAYLSDIERGNRAPLPAEKIRAAAAFLGVNADQLIVAAALSRGAFELNTANTTPKAREIGATLMRYWDELSDDTLDEIGRVIEGKNKRREAE